MAPDIIYTDGQGFADMEHNGRTIVLIEISRKTVESGLTGDVVDRLLTLSDTKHNTLTYTDSVMFSFQGYDDDSREIPDIPECREFFLKVTEAFPVWLHFLVKSPGILNLLYSLLCDVTHIPGQGYFITHEELNKVKARLADAVKKLYALHDIPDEHYEDMMRQVQACAIWS